MRAGVFQHGEASVHDEERVEAALRLHNVYGVVCLLSSCMT